MDLTKKGGKVRIRNMGDDDNSTKCFGRCLSITGRGMMRRNPGGLYTNNCREVKEARGHWETFQGSQLETWPGSDQNSWANTAFSLSTKNMGHPVQWIPRLQIHGLIFSICYVFASHTSMTKFTL